MAGFQGLSMLSRVATYYPDLSIKYVFLDIGYAAPPLGLTAAGIDALNARTLATEGYEPSGYWAFFNQSGAGYILDKHVSPGFCELKSCGTDRTGRP